MMRPLPCPVAQLTDAQLLELARRVWVSPAVREELAYRVAWGWCRG